MAALSEIEKLEARYNENPDGRFFAPLADAYRKSGQVDLALKILSDNLAKHPDYLSAHIVLGRCHLAKKDDTAALATFRNVLELDRENIIALKALAEIEERIGQTDGARRWLMRLLVVDPMNAEADADLTRLGGALPEEGAAPAAEAEPAGGMSFADLAMTEVETVPLAAIALDEPAPSMTEPTPTREMAPLSAPAGRPSEPLEPLALDPPPMELDFVEPAPPTPADLPTEQVPALDLEPTAFAPPAEEPAHMEGVTDFDDSLGWGAGERMSHAVHQEDIAEAEKHHEETTSAFEFMGAEPVPPAHPSPAQGSTVEMTPVQVGSAHIGDDEPAEPLPLIMPEDVTPPEEMRRPSVKQVQMVSPEPAGAAHAPDTMLTETMAELYLKQGFRDQAVDVYRRLVAQRPHDGALRVRLAELEAPPPALSAIALGAESVGVFLGRIARAVLGQSAPEAPPPPPAGPSPLDQAFAHPEAEGEPVPAAAAGEQPAGEPARPASEAFSLDQIFGGPGAAAAAAPPPPPPQAAAPPAQAGSSFDEFFGAAPAAEESVRPRQSRAPRASEDDLSAFNAWLHGLKR